MFLVVPSKITLAFPLWIIKKRGEIHLAFAMYMIGAIIPHSSILRTIPVAFIYIFLLKLQIVLLLSVF